MATTVKITRDDIESKLREVSGEVDDTVQSAKPQVLSAVIAGAILIALISYLLGRRGGKKRSAMVEIRRF